MATFSFRHWLEETGSDLPSDLQGTLFAKGLNRGVMNNNAKRMSQELDAKHANDQFWQQNVETVRRALDGVPFIHVGSVNGVRKMWRTGILPSADLVARGMIDQDPLEFDRISGLDHTTFYRQGQPGGRPTSPNMVGILIDPKKLDPKKLIITKLGFMALKQKEDKILRRPGDHTKLVDAQLRRYRATTINYEDMPTIQAKLLVDGYLSTYPNEANKALDPDKVVANDKGEMEIKYVGSVGRDAMMGFLAPEQVAQSLVEFGVPANLIKTFKGGFTELEAFYRRLYLKSPTHIK